MLIKYCEIQPQCEASGWSRLVWWRRPRTK